MELCSSGHEEICYANSNRFCPVCTEIEDLTDKLDEATNEISKLKDEVEQLNAELVEYDEKSL